MNPDIAALADSLGIVERYALQHPPRPLLIAEADALEAAGLIVVQTRDDKYTHHWTRTELGRRVADHLNGCG